MCMSIICMHACMYVCVSHVCLRLMEIRGGVGSPGTGGIHGYELLLGAGSQTQVLRKSNQCKLQV